MITPNHSVTGTDHIQRQIQFLEFIYLLFDESAERHENIGIVLDAFLIQFGLIDQVVEKQSTGKMLAKCIVAEKDIFLCQEAEQAVRPMEQGRFYKKQFASPQIQCISRLNLD